jgi:hypothetical protein
LCMRHAALAVSGDEAGRHLFLTYAIAKHHGVNGGRR